MNTDNQNSPKTKSKRKPKTEKPLCTSPNCGPVKALKKSVKDLAEENARVKQQLADRDVRIEELEAHVLNLRGDLFGPSSEKLPTETLCLAAKDGVPIEDFTDSADPVCTLPKEGKKKRGAQIGHRGHGRQISTGIPVVEVVHEIPADQMVCSRCGKPYRYVNLFGRLYGDRLRS